MPKTCDNKCTGVLIWKNGSLLLIERKKYNPGFACPAGHNDGDPPNVCARKEASEEVGLNLEVIDKKLEIRLENQCSRDGGDHHDWTIFNVLNWSGNIVQADDEVKSYLWADREKLKEFAAKTERFMKEAGVSSDNMTALVVAVNDSEAWHRDPGLEPPWYVILKKLEII